MSAVKGKCYQWRAKGQCSQGVACSFHHDGSKRGKKTHSSSPAPRPQTQNGGKKPSKGKPPRGSRCLEGDIKKRADVTLKETVRNRHVTIGILPCVKITNLIRAKKTGGEDSAALLKNSKQSHLRIPGKRAAKSNSIERKGAKFLGPKRKVQFSVGALRHVKNRERKGPSQGVTQHSNPHERSPHAPKFEDRSEEETMQQERCARRVARKIA